MKEHIVYFDVLRVVAIFAVIMVHLVGVHFNMNVFSFNWEIANIWQGLLHWGVPVFVMISGALFLDSAKEITFHKLYSKNILHLLTVFIFWSVFYALTSFIAGSYKGDINKLLANIFLGHFHLWFLWMLMGLYIIVPLLRPICSDIKLVRYFLLLSLFFSFVIPTFIKISTGIELINSSEILSKILQTLNVWLNEKIYFYFTLGYVAYFVLGYYINKISILPKYRKILYGLGLLSCILSICFTRFVSHLTDSTFNFYLQSNLTLYVLFESLAIFVFAKYNIQYFPKLAIKTFSYLSKNVLGIYLVHIFILVCLSRYFHLSVGKYNPLFSVPLISLLVFVLSCITTEIIKKIPILNKYIV